MTDKPKITLEEMFGGARESIELRDLFAAFAMLGEVSRHGMAQQDYIVAVAYDLADAMLGARNRK